MRTGDYAGRVVEFLDGNQLKLGLVREQSQEKLQVTDSNGRQRRVAARQVVVAHAPPPDPSQFAHFAEQLDAQIRAIGEEVDTELLWESLRDDLRDYDVDELAGSYFGDAGSPRVSALFRAVRGDAVRFKVRGRTVQPRPPETVEAQLNAIRNEAQRVAQRERGTAWLLRILSLPPDPASEIEVPEEFASLLRRVEDLLVKGTADSVAGWLEEISSRRPARETAYEILRRAGRLPADTDRRLVIAGIQDAFPRRVISEVEELAPYVSDPARSAVAGPLVVSIDDEDTTEVDDALSVERIASGDAGAAATLTRVGIHIADVSRFVEKDSALDREAARRGATIYLPYRSVPMFPERLSSGLASLRRGELRPTLSFFVDFGDGATVVNCEMRRAEIAVDHCLSYDAADTSLAASDASDPLARSLRDLDRVAQALAAARRARGALFLTRPELKIRARDAEVTVKTLDPDSPSRALVREMMVLANRLAAELAWRDRLPILYRAQDPPEEALPEIEGYDPVRLDQVFRRLKRSRFSLHPQPHHGLGLDAYTQLTSPIRRLQDLVMQRQLVAHLSGAALPYEQQELLEILSAAQTVEAESRAFEARVNRVFVLRFLAEHWQDRSHAAVVISRLPATYLVELRELPVRGQLRARGNLEPGAEVTVAIEDIQPEGDVLHFALAS